VHVPSAPLQNLEGSCGQDEGFARLQDAAAIAEGDVGVLGSAPAAADTTLRSSGEEAAPERWLIRPADLVRALNGCGRGEVISERQLRRHRNRAGTAICCGRKIDFIAYAAWLTLQCDHDGSEPGTVDVRNVLRLIQNQDYRCALTGRRLAPEDAALDHIVPVSRGGEHVMENVQVLQKQVNRVKHTLTNEEFIALCREVVAHADGANSNHKEAQ
jgi:5-methylcytosine-specific restriction endonuclease McrA